MSVTVTKIDGSKGAAIDLPENIFGLEPNEALVHTSIVAHLANRRQGTASTKGRGDVRGGGTKPWRQKGTGRSRAGTIRSPLWPGGGIIFGPKPRDYAQKLHKKQRRLAIKSVLSDKARNQRIMILENLKLPDHKTRNFVALLEKLGLKGKNVLLLDEGNNVNPYRAARNIPGAKVCRARLANVFDILRADYLIITQSGLKEIEEVFGR